MAPQFLEWYEIMIVLNFMSMGPNRILAFLEYVLVILIMTTFIACGYNNLSYDELLAKESLRIERIDSLFYEVSLGITYDDFLWYCYNRNGKGQFRQNISGTAVVLDLNNEEEIIELEFFPEGQFVSKHDIISKYNGVVRFKDFTYYNKDLSIENLVKETIEIFEQGYGGNEFIVVPSKTLGIKNDFIKLDANRKITLRPTFEGDKLFIEFLDLKPLNNVRKN